MAKIRVYELAKYLNMTNKELLDKILDLNIKVSSHMSSLDDEFVKKIKSELFGNLGKGMDEKRVHPTIIRRRKKVKQEEENKKIFFDSDTKIRGIDHVLESEKNIVSSEDINITDIDYLSCEDVISSGNKIDKTEKSELENKGILFKNTEKNCFNFNIFKSKKTDISLKENNNFKRKLTKKLKKDKDNKIEVAGKFIKKEDTLSQEKNKNNINTFVNSKGDRLIEKKKSKIDLNYSKGGKEEINGNRFKKNKIIKDKPAKILKKVEAPAKIIKKAKLVKKVFDEKKLYSQEPNFKYDRGVNYTNPVEDPSARRNQKKKRKFKKKENVESTDVFLSKKRGRRIKKGRKFKTKPGVIIQKTKVTVAKAIKRRIKIDETIVLTDLAKRLGIKVNLMITKLLSMGIVITVNQTVDFDTACLLASEFDYEVERASFEEESILKKTVEDDPNKMVKRPPVVTIMGHVDHGKTSLLDVIRQTRVTDDEAGGITQHIGAYRVETQKGVVVFLDTPGHEAFSAMRSRGAKVTDIVVLVIAADDGVMPQTLEAINHSKASKVPIIVAINKMDKINSNPEKVLRELSEHDLIPEKWGGDVITVEVSAKKNKGIETLLDMILLQAEMLELRANPDKLSRGHVVESRLDSGRGPVATVLVQEGTLRSGDSVICGVHYGKIRALHNDIGQKVIKATPSTPVEIIGLSGVPMAGDELVGLTDEKDAKQVSLYRTQKQRAKELAKTSRLSLEGLFERMQKGEIKDLNLIIKADVDGSIEALKTSLIKLSNEEVDIKIIHSATGTISESDISLAAVSNAVIIGFNVRPNSKIQNFASDENVDMRFYDVIYNVIKDVKNAIIGMMKSRYEEKILGKAEVRQVFHVPKIGVIAGSYVTEGKLTRGSSIRLLRDGVIVFQGKNSSLRRFKEDVKEVNSGYECGIGIENFNDIKIGDVLELYYMEEIKPEID